MKKHQSEVFIRILFMILLLKLEYLRPALIFIALIQLLSIFFDKKPILSLVIISQYALSYLIDIFEYLSGIHSSPPFPFSPWKNRYDP